MESYFAVIHNTQNALYHRSIAAKNSLKEMNTAETTLDIFSLNIIMFCMLFKCIYSQFRSVKMIYRVRKSCIKNQTVLYIYKIYLPNPPIVLSGSRTTMHSNHNECS